MIKENFLKMTKGGRLLQGKMAKSFFNFKSARGAKYREYGKLFPESVFLHIHTNLQPRKVRTEVLWLGKTMKCQGTNKTETTEVSASKAVKKRTQVKRNTKNVSYM